MIIVPYETPKRTRDELARYVIDSLKAAGIRIPPSCRLQRMHEVYLKSTGMIETNDPGFETALEAERDMQLLGFVFDQLDASNPSDAMLKRLEDVVNDSVLPQCDRKQSTGRDATFELYVAAICKSADFTPVAFEEPDITCFWDGTKFGIAAKRIKSTKKLLKRIRGAVNQIERSGMPGIIALDTCLAFNPNNDRVYESMADSIFMSKYWKDLRDIWEQYDSRAQDLVSRANVLGIIVHDHRVHFCEDEKWSAVGMTMRVPATRHPKPMQKLFETFSTLYAYALPNQEDVSRPTIELP